MINQADSLLCSSRSLWMRRVVMNVAYLEFRKSFKILSHNKDKLIKYGLGK